MRNYKVVVNLNESFKIKANSLFEASQIFLRDYVDIHKVDKKGNIL